MSDENGIYCIWLDLHIGILGKYQTFKEKFQKSLKPINGLPPNSINNLILCFEQEVAPIKFVSNIDDALALIQNETDKRIILISSGSLGKDAVPLIYKNYPRVYSYYIFCANILNYLDWAMDYLHCLKIFDHETDLLIRLTRDISQEFIRLGRSYLAVYDGESARKCFVTAETLETHANDANSPNPPVRRCLEMLQGPNGLIEKSQNLKDDQRTDETIGSNNLLIYTIEDDTKLVDGITRYSNVDDLVDKLVELVVKKYQQQAETHMHEGQRQLADIEIRMANRIEYEVQKLRES
ncbi:unnamed protein product [Rotaria sp. Silwood1]|nr:unnamed protein product [Rotaria sp. Silwood1]CAF3525220.1 unnamed protein product [Rotaria sp. Silwood1]CAF4696583.1 unnamed protein product [Rotaria sp. Silwood1]CAF4848646.1 unnamed protein product [Rotaria sp. Silwood1]